MADIPAIAPVTFRNASLARLKLPTLRIGASLAAISGMLGEAFRMAYVDPYTSRDRQTGSAPEDDLEGRDPNW